MQVLQDVVSPIRKEVHFQGRSACPLPFNHEYSKDSIK